MEGSGSHSLQVGGSMCELMQKERADERGRQMPPRSTCAWCARLVHWTVQWTVQWTRRPPHAQWTVDGHIGSLLPLHIRRLPPLLRTHPPPYGIGKEIAESVADGARLHHSPRTVAKHRIGESVVEGPLFASPSPRMIAKRGVADSVAGDALLAQLSPCIGP
eukprot:360663-Chlamydomonas_euryale.AAC.2